MGCQSQVSWDATPFDTLLEESMPQDVGHFKSSPNDSLGQPFLFLNHSRGCHVVHPCSFVFIRVKQNDTAPTHRFQPGSYHRWISFWDQAVRLTSNHPNSLQNHQNTCLQQASRSWKSLYINNLLSRILVWKFRLGQLDHVNN